jgi:hypothetical protein
VKKITLNGADVDAIIQRTRRALADELQYIIDHGMELTFTPGEHNQLGVDLSIIMAQRARQGNGRRTDTNAEFIGKVLGPLSSPLLSLPPSLALLPACGADVSRDECRNDQHECSDNIIDLVSLDAIHPRKPNLNHVEVADQRCSHNGDGEYGCGEG